MLFQGKSDLYGGYMKIEDLNFMGSPTPVDEKNFDLEKWRRDNPIDYYKAISILNKANRIEKDYLFQEIYKITRLYIPNILYKFYSLTDNNDLNEQKFNTLLNNQIFMANINTFNDPFDSKAFYYDSSQLMGYGRLSEFDGKLIDDFTSYIKTTSLTSNDENNMPMWAHYANNHSGFCVLYKKENNPSLFSTTFPVQYTDTRLDVTSLMKSQAEMIINEISVQTELGRKEVMINDLSIIYMICLLCNIKQLTWKYEQEFRCTTAANAKGMPYIKAVPNEIYIGYKCNEANKKKLSNIASGLGIPIYVMQYKETASGFELFKSKMK